MLILKMENNLKIYSLLLETKDQIYLSTQYTGSLEDAYALAKLEFEVLNPTMRGDKNPLIGSKIWLFTTKTADELFRHEIRTPKSPMRFKRLKMEEAPTITQKPEVEDVSKKEGGLKFDKNYLMKKIIEDKNLKSLKKNKDLLTENDVKYVKDQIKKKKD